MTLPDILLELEPSLQQKAAKLMDQLSQMPSLVIAFSGGVDSGLLCALGYHALGERMLAVTVRSPVEAPGDFPAADALARQVGFRHQVVAFDDLKNPKFVENSADRCYFCKLERLRSIQMIAVQSGLDQPVVAEGSNAEDAHDYRPGSRAVAELSIRSPLAEAGLCKAEIRALAQALGLNVWDRPSAPCLATRFPYGTPVTHQGLKQIAQGEAFLRESGFAPVRVRHYGRTARLEVAVDRIDALIAMRESVLLFFKSMGFTYVVVDMAGYRMGSMNEVLQP
jgi:uncharacterized protein